MINIAGYQRFSLSDYPGKPAAVVFTRGCNFRCPYCHNPSLVTGHGPVGRGPVISKDAIIHFLAQRRGKLSGVVLTGGEPTLQPGLLDFAEEIKDLGFCIKLDTNGGSPGVLKTLIEASLVDYIAMDIKGPLEKYARVVNAPVDIKSIRRSVSMIMQSGVEYEFRTTVAPSLLSPVDLEACARLIAGAKRYILQSFVSHTTLDPAFKNEATYPVSELQEVSRRLEHWVDSCEVR